LWLLEPLREILLDVLRLLRDVQQLAGHASLVTTQRYIEGNSDAKRSAIEALGKLWVRG
jgi:integrase